MPERVYVREKPKPETFYDWSSISNYIQFLYPDKWLSGFADVFIHSREVNNGEVIWLSDEDGDGQTPGMVQMLDIILKEFTGEDERPGHNREIRIRYSW